MKHSFQGKSAKCTVCDYDYMAHTVAAICEACSNVAECDIYPAPKSKFSLLLCATCYEKEVKTNEELADNVIARTNVSQNEMPAIRSYDLVRDLIKQEDNSIRYSGDIFNAEVVAIADIQKQCMADESLGTIDERFFAFQGLVATRVEDYKKKIFDLDDQKHTLVAQQRAAIETLRDFGTKIRAEIRERIKLADAIYQPAPVVKVPKITKPKVSAEDRLIEAFAAMHNISLDKAKEQIAKLNLGNK